MNNSNINNLTSTNMKTKTTSLQQPSFDSLTQPEMSTSGHQINEQISTLFQQMDSKLSLEFFNQQQKISPENFAAFCEQLHSFVQCVKNIQEITSLTYNLPSQLQESLDEEAKELDCLYGEVREATNNIERIKTQRKAIRKEKIAAEKLLRKLKDEEAREMETVISVYDRGMFARWEIIKNSRKLEAIENFLCDIEGKLLAMKHLKVLATQKMNKVITWTLKETTERKNRKEIKKAGEKENGSTNTTTVTEQQETKRKKTKHPRLSKTELPKIEVVNNRTPAYNTTDESESTDRSHDSIRAAVELNSEMQSVLRTLFGGPNREAIVPAAQIQTNNTTANTSSTSSNSATTENREIHIFLSHSYLN
ncbi:uncharacterized protein LOC142327734 [Lycorma delicatula]|uniref:uncharacterized protein LOC142327734 n=1 Tax=Lycorma delicatula TaxID=130591 RepID=UPI003F518F9C